MKQQIKGLLIILIIFQLLSLNIQELKPVDGIAAHYL